MNCSSDLASVRALARLLLGDHLVGQEEIPRELLRDGAAADEIRAVAEDVGEHRADDADRIDAGMVVEAAIFDRQHRFLHARRNGLERDAAALLARAGHQRRQQRRIERDALERLAGRLDLRPRAAAGAAAASRRSSSRGTGGSGNDTVTTLPA